MQGMPQITYQSEEATSEKGSASLTIWILIRSIPSPVSRDVPWNSVISSCQEGQTPGKVELGKAKNPCKSRPLCRTQTSQSSKTVGKKLLSSCNLPSYTLCWGTLPVSPCCTSLTSLHWASDQICQASPANPPG